jgi:hypothetical protein
MLVSVKVTRSVIEENAVDDICIRLDDVDYLVERFCL